MPYDEGLAQRIREHLENRTDVEEKKMFGGLCFMVSNHMCCGIVKDTLMLRVGPDNYEKCLARKYATEMDFTGRALKGMLYISPNGFDTDSKLADWLNIATNFVKSLPPKLPKKNNSRKKKPKRK